MNYYSLRLHEMWLKALTIAAALEDILFHQCDRGIDCDLLDLYLVSTIGYKIFPNKGCDKVLLLESVVQVHSQRVIQPLYADIMEVYEQSVKILSNKCRISNNKTFISHVQAGVFYYEIFSSVPFLIIFTIKLKLLNC